MGYLNDFGVQLAEKLAALPAAEREEIVAFVKAAVLASYKNGLRDGGTPPRPRAPRSAKRS